MRILLKNSKLLLAAVLLSTVATAFAFWQNNSITISEYDYFNSNIPETFDGLRITQVSDLHNKGFGENQGNLLDKVQSTYPDIIFVTGDLVDRRRYDLDTAMKFIRGAVKIAPVYYIPGNHEAWCDRYGEVREELESRGVYVLDNAEAELKVGRSSVRLLGVMDPGFQTYGYTDEADTSEMEEALKSWSNGDEFKILLSHRPELFDLYSENGMDLIFAGHAHGGQIRLPGIGGLFAPGQGMFPRYTSGSYVKGGSTMYVSRGLGNSAFPVRVFNRPEVVSVTVRVEQDGHRH